VGGENGRNEGMKTEKRNGAKSEVAAKGTSMVASEWGRELSRTGAPFLKGVVLGF